MTDGALVDPEAADLEPVGGEGADEVDELTGPRIGRPKSATYRTADSLVIDGSAGDSVTLKGAGGQQWVDTKGQGEFWAQLSRDISAQAGLPLVFSS